MLSLPAAAMVVDNILPGLHLRPFPSGERPLCLTPSETPTPRDRDAERRTGRRGESDTPKGEDIMTPVRMDALVRLTEDDPAHHLRRGAEGTVVNVWPSSVGLLCEVEFCTEVKAPPIRALLRAGQLEVVEPRSAGGRR
jgi:hypothetical protein